MVIRPVVLKDKCRILRLLKEAKAFNEAEINTAMEVFDDAVLRVYENEYLAFCSEDDGGKIVGYACFGPIPMTDASYDLYWIAVDRSCLRMGLGSELLAFVESFITNNNGRKIYVETSSTEKYNAARSFYTKHGYRMVSTLDDFYRKGDHKVTYMKEVGTIHVWR